MRISDWSADVCSSDLRRGVARTRTEGALMRLKPIIPALLASALMAGPAFAQAEGPSQRTLGTTTDGKRIVSMVIYGEDPCRSEEHTSELQSLMRISYAVFCLKKKTQHTNTTNKQQIYNHSKT